MCSIDYLTKLAETAGAIFSLYANKLNLIGKMNKVKSSSEQDVDEDTCTKMSNEILLERDKVLIYDAFRKILLIGLEKKWDDYKELLASYLKGITDYPGLNSTNIDSDTEKMYSEVIELLNNSQSSFAQADKNILISCRNILYKS